MADRIAARHRIERFRAHVFPAIGVDMTRRIADRRRNQNFFTIEILDNINGRYSHHVRNPHEMAPPDRAHVVLILNAGSSAAIAEVSDAGGTFPLSKRSSQRPDKLGPALAPWASAFCVITRLATAATMPATRMPNAGYVLLTISSSSKYSLLRRRHY